MNNEQLNNMAHLYVQALQMYAFSGDAACLLAPQRQLLGVQNEEGNTPLMTAISSGNTEASIKILFVANGDLLNFVNKEGNSALLLSAMHGNTEVALRLLEKDNIDLTIYNKKGNNVFHLAGNHGLISVVCEKISNNQQQQHLKKELLNGFNLDGNTPLLQAVSENNNQKTLSLLINGGDATIANRTSGENIFHLIVKQNDLKLMATAISYFTSIAATPKFMSQLINHEDSFGNTPLHYALQYNHSALVQPLICNGADVSVMNSQCQTPFDLGQQNYNIEAINAVFNVLGVPTTYEQFNQQQAQRRQQQQQVQQKSNLRNIPSIKITQKHLEATKSQPTQQQSHSTQKRDNTTNGSQPPLYKDITKYKSLPNANELEQDADDSEWQMLTDDGNNQSIERWKLHNDRKFKLKMFNNSSGNDGEKKKEKKDNKEKKSNIFKTKLGSNKEDEKEKHSKKRSNSSSNLNKLSEIRAMEEEQNSAHGKVLKKLSAVDDDMSTLD